MKFPIRIYTQTTLPDPDKRSLFAVGDETLHYSEPVTAIDYETALNKYEIIREADIYLVDNKKESLDSTIALEVAYAMQIKKPIVLTDVPSFSKKTNFFLQGMIMARLNKIMIADVGMLDPGDIRNFLINTSAQAINYQLTRHETTLVSSYLKTHFRGLLT